MGNLCIYSRKTAADGAHFEEKEHILSAGLGGIHCLSKGMVSDEVNLHFSRWERSFMRDSLLAIPRQFHGPGKRGSLSSKKASKSKVHVYNPSDLETNENPEEVGLCYISLGIAYSIPTLQIKKGTFKIYIPERDDWESFIGRLLKCPEDGFINVHSDHMPTETALLGFHLGEWHLAQGDGFELQTLVQHLQNLKTGQINNLSQQESEYCIHSHQHLTYDEEDYYKVIVKYAFNFLARCIGQDAILASTFDPLRDWIMSETSDDNPAFKYLVTVTDSNSKLPAELPELAHFMTIAKKNERELTALVCLYGGAVMHHVLLSANYGQEFKPKRFICDWKNGKEEFS